MRTIQYMIDNETGTVFSQVKNEVAVPVLDFEGMQPENKWKMNYNLEKFSAFDIYPHCSLTHTRKIPVACKNIHRKFWGMKPLPVHTAL